MSFEPGGYADKLGNRHEGRWVVKQLLRLLLEQLRSVTLEAVGDDQRGVDLVVEENSGRRQYQQCRARNGSQEHWTIADLHSAKILASMGFQLDRGPEHEFALVSGVPASMLDDICKSARNSNGNPEDFYRFQIQEPGEPRRKAYRQFCEYLDLREDAPADRARAFGYLRRMHVILWRDDRNNDDELTDLARVLVRGKPANVVACLAQYALDNLRKRLTADAIWKHLQESGFDPKRLVHDDRVAPALERLQRRFEESIKPLLIDGRLIPRKETQELLKVIEEGGVAVLHGTAGCGKSGVLYELTTILKGREIPYLPVRLDRQPPGDTVEQFGAQLGLPESPVLCLESQLRGNKGLLLLDQLDALRWTGAHAVNALEVCKDMVRQARGLHRSGTALSVVLSCRTFDLEHDPQIKAWLEKQGGESTPVRKIPVKGLPDEAIKEVVTRLGGNFGAFTAEQKKILASVQHLAMWATIAHDGCVSGFRSSTELMKKYWENRYQELEKAGVTGTEADKILDTLVGYMEKHGTLTAPARLIGNRQKPAHELQTLAVIRTSDGQVTFCHQSYLDFRIADRLLQKMHQGERTVKDWLGPREKQSLFRCEQLRQVLLLLSDDAPDDFLDTMRELLGAGDVRFHLKHLILEVVAEIAEPGQPLCEYLLERWTEAYWRPHINATVLHGHPQYIQFLIDRGVASRLLDGTDETDRNTMLWLLHGVASQIPDPVAGLLAPYVDRGGEWPQLVLGGLCWGCEDDSDSMFEIRLRLARLGVLREYVQWQKLAAVQPMRIPRLIEAVMSAWDTPSPQDDSSSCGRGRSHLENWTADDLQAMKAAVRSCPLETWKLLMPHVERLTANCDNRRDAGLKDWLYGDRFELDEGGASIRRGIVELLCESGSTMASSDPESFLACTQRLRSKPSLAVEEILITSYAALPPQYADEAVRWLLTDRRRFRLGPGYNENEWTPAVRLVSNQSPHCSETLFRELEDAIVHYHSPEERLEAQCRLPRWKEGYFGDYWGRTQHFLLPALYARRRSQDVEGLIGVLDRKFGHYPEGWSLRVRGTRAAYVGSPIRGEGLHRLSNKAWLRIINDESIPPTGIPKWTQFGTDQVVESSVVHFANDFRVAARRWPTRFARLALKFPVHTHPSYIAAVLDGIKAIKPDEIPEEERSWWTPAEREAIEAIIERFYVCEDGDVARNFCWLIRTRADEHWSDRILDRLLDYAMRHPDPQEGGPYICGPGQESREWTVDDLRENAINCTRGVAASAIGALLWEHGDWLAKLRPALEHLASDPHPAVRVAAVEACLPVLKMDKDLAINLFLRACQDDLRVAACGHGVYYFNSCMQSHKDRLYPIIVSMFHSNVDDIAKRGAAEVCARWIFHGFFAGELNEGMSGSIPQREAIAEVAAILMDRDEDYREKCQELLFHLFDDPHKEVRQKAAHAVWHKPELLGWSGSNSFICQFIHSQAFRDNPTGTLLTFETYPGVLLPFAETVFALCQEFLGPLAEVARDTSRDLSYDAGKVISLLLRLYEQTERHDPKIAERCLDAWDALFEKRIGSTSDLMKAIGG